MVVTICNHQKWQEEAGAAQALVHREADALATGCAGSRGRGDRWDAPASVCRRAQRATGRDAQADDTTFRTLFVDTSACSQSVDGRARE